MPLLKSTLFLFPSFEHHRVHVGTYGHESVQNQLNVVETPVYRLNGLDMGWSYYREDSMRDWLDIDDLMDTPDWPRGTELPFRVRAYVDDQGTVQLDQLQIETYLVSVRSRQNQGDMVDLSFLGGYREHTIGGTDTGRFQYRTLMPTDITLLGFSNTDYDDDDRLKYYIGAGGGIGGEIIGRVFGPFGVYGKAIGFARTFNRHQKDTRNQVRHELQANLEAGAALLGQRQAFWLSGWAELSSQYETRDEDKKNGVDRQYGAWGIRLTGRFGPAYNNSEDEEGENFL